LQHLVVDIVAQSVLTIQTQQRRYYDRNRYCILHRLAINIQRIREEYYHRKRMKQYRLIMCRFMLKVTTKQVARRLSRMLISLFRRLKVRRGWRKLVLTMKRFIALCRKNMMKIKYQRPCDQFCDILSVLRGRRALTKLCDAFGMLRDVYGTNYRHYIPNKIGVEFAFRSVITKLQKAWQWKSKLFYALHAEGCVSTLVLSKDSMLYYMKQKDKIMQNAPRAPRQLSHVPHGKDLLRANRLILWAMYANYVSLAATSPTSKHSIDHQDRYNARALPMKHLIILMKDWELCPQVVNPTAITNIMDHITNSEYYFLNFDDDVWGRRFPASAPNSPSKRVGPPSSLSPPNTRGKRLSTRQLLEEDGSLEVSFNMFCQMLLHIASALSDSTDRPHRRSSQYTAAPTTILSVTTNNIKEIGFQDSSKVGLNLRLLLTVMDRSNGRNKLGNSRSSIAVPPLNGVVGSRDLDAVSPKKVSSGRIGSPVKQRRHIVSQPMNAQVLAVVKSNRAQLLLIALHYSRFNPSAHSRVLSEKEKIGYVYLSKEDVWNITVDFGVCPSYCRCIIG
jgi:hypothetical protein